MIPEVTVSVVLATWLVASLGVRSALRLIEKGEQEDERAAWQRWVREVDSGERREAAETRRRERRGVWSACTEPTWSFADHLDQLKLNGRVVRNPTGGLYIAEATGEAAHEEARRHWRERAKADRDEAAREAEADQAQEPPDVRR